MTTTTNFPQRPARAADPSQVAWTVWQNLLWFVATVYDQFASKFDSGSATVLASTTSISVAHHLGVGAFAAIVTPTADPGSRFWVSGKSTSSFTINLQSAPVGAVTFDWMVKAP